MVRMHCRNHLFYFSLAFLCFSITACTVATPNLSALNELSPFSGKSASPFNQENPGGMIFMSGQCLPTVTSFELRLNHLPVWSAISSTAPSPGSGEYQVGNPVYDVDCSDGEFNFWVYTSQAMDNFTLNSTTGGPGDPSEIELRGIDSNGDPISPTIVYVRPPPNTFSINSNNYSNFSDYMEVGRKTTYRIKLLDAFGNHSMVGSGQTLVMTVTPVDLMAAVSPAGTIYESTCTTPATAADLTFNPGDDELTICYDSTGATAGDTIQIEVAATGMLNNFVQIPLKAQNSAGTYLSSASMGGGLPPILLRGVTYKFTMGLNPLYSNNFTRNVQGYIGNFKVDAFNIYVDFTDISGDPECPDTGTASLTCFTTSNTNKSFTMKVTNSYPMSTLSVGVYANATPGCSAGCRIFESPTSYNITDYVSSMYYFGVVDGSTTYSTP